MPENLPRISPAPGTSPPRADRTRRDHRDAVATGRRCPRLSSFLAGSRPPWAGHRIGNCAGGSRYPSRRSSDPPGRRMTRLVRHLRRQGRRFGRAASRDKGQQGGRAAASLRRHGYQLSLSVSGEGQAGPDVLPGKVGKVAQDLILRHAGSEVLQDVIDRDAQPADAGLATALPLLDGDSVLIPYGEKPTLGAPRRSNLLSGHQIPADQSTRPCELPEPRVCLDKTYDGRLRRYHAPRSQAR